MSDDFDLALHAKAEYLDFEVGSLKAQLAFANRRIEHLELENENLLDQLREVRDAYDDELLRHGDRGAY